MDMGGKWDYVQVESLVEFVLALSWRVVCRLRSSLWARGKLVIEDHE
jgi:hypothetical protein